MMMMMRQQTDASLSHNGERAKNGFISRPRLCYSAASVYIVVVVCL